MDFILSVRTGRTAVPRYAFPAIAAVECSKLNRQALAIRARTQQIQEPWCCAMQDFVHRKNLEHYRKLLAGTPDEAERELLLRLLAEEQAKERPRTTVPGEDTT